MREIMSGIFTWPWFSERHGYNFNGHLIRHSGGALCVDPVEPDDDALAQIIASQPTHIVLTNRNHVRAANLVRNRTGAAAVIHRHDADYARQQGAEIDAYLGIGSRIGPCTVIDASGKSPGEIALHWPARRLLLVGDVVIGNPPGHCSLLPEKVMDDPARLRASVRRLLDLDFDALLVGDGTTLTGDAKVQLRALVETFSS
jgi:glyoxylase-like metal-dependent hydrolase (beta-lactamase superfamily II)